MGRVTTNLKKKKTLFQRVLFQFHWLWCSFLARRNGFLKIYPLRCELKSWNGLSSENSTTHRFPNEQPIIAGIYYYYYYITITTTTSTLPLDLQSGTLISRPQRRSVEVEVTLRQSVSQYVLVSSTLLGLAARYYFLSECCCLKFAVLYLWGALGHFLLNII
jgi:hypothetical protein